MKGKAPSFPRARRPINPQVQGSRLPQEKGASKGKTPARARYPINPQVQGSRLSRGKGTRKGKTPASRRGQVARLSREKYIDLLACDAV